MSQPSARAWMPAIGRAIATLGVAALAAGCGTVAASSNGAGGVPTASASATAGSGPAATPTPTPVPTITATGSPSASPGQTECADWPASAPTGPLPASFVPVTVLRCVTGTKLIPGKGLFLAGTLQRADKDLGPLVAALREPSSRPQSGMMCPMIAMLPQHIVLVAKDGSMVSPNIPVDGCGNDQHQVLQALNSLSWQTLSVRLYSQVSGTPGSTASPSTVSPSGPDQPVDPVHGMNGTPAVNTNR